MTVDREPPHPAPPSPGGPDVGPSVAQLIAGTQVPDRDRTAAADPPPPELDAPGREQDLEQGYEL